MDKLTDSYCKFLSQWKAKSNNYPLFFGLRDFYCLIKQFAAAIGHAPANELVKDVLEQCRRGSGGRSVLLCYEEKQTEGMSKIESSSKHIRQEKEKRQQERQK